MMKIRVCDRCHRQMGQIVDAYRFKVKGLDPMSAGDDIDGHLCLRCRRDLDDWMREVRKEKNDGGAKDAEFKSKN